MINSQQFVPFIVPVVWLLCFRDYVYIFNETLSPIISGVIYSILVIYFCLDIIVIYSFTILWRFAIMLSLLLAITALHIGSYPILTVFLMVYLCVKFPIDTIVRVFLYPRLMMSIIAIVMYEFGMTNDVEFVAMKISGYDISHTMGISNNPNTTASYFFSAILLIYLYGRITKQNLLLFLPIIIAIYITKNTMCRTLLYSTIALYIFDFLFRRYKERGKMFIKIIMILPFFFIIMTFLGSVFFFENQMLNELFSGRLSLWHNYVSKLSLKDFMIGSGDSLEILIDSGFMQLFIMGGVTVYIPFLVLLKQSLIVVKIEDMFYVPFIITCLTYSFSESMTMIKLCDVTVLLYLLLYNRMLNCDIIKNRNQ